MSEYEKQLIPGISFCDIDKHVLAKANEMGALTELVSESKTNKAILANEVINKSDNSRQVNIYAFLKFTQTSDSGYGYLKLYDVKMNLAKIKLLLGAIKQFTGEEISEAYFIERYVNSKN